MFWWWGERHAETSFTEVYFVVFRFLCLGRYPGFVGWHVPDVAPTTCGHQRQCGTLWGVRGGHAHSQQGRGFWIPKELKNDLKSSRTLTGNYLQWSCRRWCLANDFFWCFSPCAPTSSHLLIFIFLHPDSIFGEVRLWGVFVRLWQFSDGCVRSFVENGLIVDYGNLKEVPFQFRMRSRVSNATVIWEISVWSFVRLSRNNFHFYGYLPLRGSNLSPIKI